MPRGDFIRRSSWWKENVCFARMHARHFILPAVAVALSNILAAIANEYLRGMAGALGGEVDLPRLLTTTLAMLAGLVVALVLAFWGLYAWFAKLLVFCRVWFERAAPQSAPFKERLGELKSQKKYLGSLSFWLSIYLLIPALILSVLIAFSILNSPQFSIAGNKMFSLPGWSVYLINAGITVVSILTMAYTLLGLAIAARSTDLSGQRAAVLTGSLFIKWFAPLMVLSIVVALVNVIVTSPGLMLLLTPAGEALATNMWVNIALQGWLGITSLVVWPLSLLPYCSLVEDGGETSR